MMFDTQMSPRLQLINIERFILESLTSVNGWKLLFDLFIFIYVFFHPHKHNTF